MHPGGAGTPPAGGGSGAPRPGPARPGRGRGPPRLVSGARPVGMGTPPRPRSRSRPQDRMVPPRHSLAGASVAPIRGCPYGGGSPWHSRVPPGQTAEDHQAQTGPPPAHRGDVKQTPQCPAPVPPAPPPRIPHPTPSLLQPGRLKPPQEPLGHLPPLVSSARLPPAPHLCPLSSTYPGTPSHSPPQCQGPPLEPHRSCPGPYRSPWRPTCGHACASVRVCPLHVFGGLRGAHRGDSAGACEHGPRGDRAPGCLLPHGLALPWGLPVDKEKGHPPWGPAMGQRGETYKSGPQTPFVSPLHTPAPDPPWPFPPAFSAARTVIALIGIGGPEWPHLRPPPPPIPVTWGSGAI